MDSFEWNKILGAILGTLLFLFIVREAAHIIYPAEDEAEELAYKIEMPETEAGEAGEEPKQVDFGALLREASAERGESVARRCLQCHTFDKGGPHKTGPNLWGVLGADIARTPDFRYSNALSKLDGEWTYERLYEFIGAPSRYVPGTNMNFAGLRRQQQRIDLLAYLRTQADKPPPLPEPLPEEEEDEGTPEGEGAPEEGTDGGAAAANGESTSEEAAGEDGEAAAETEDAAGGGAEEAAEEGADTSGNEEESGGAGDSQEAESGDEDGAGGEETTEDGDTAGEEESGGDSGDEEGTR